jgi:hypothetical protein
MTVVCNEQHGLEVGQAFAVVGSDVPIAISSLTRSGAVGTLVTATKHDLTSAIAETIRITGATEDEFNGTFNILDITNRKTITFTILDTSVFTYDNQASKFEGVFTNLSNESVVVSSSIRSTGSLKATAIGGSGVMSVKNINVEEFDASALTNLSLWVYVDSNVFANLTVTDAFRMRISSDASLGTDWNEYRFDKSVFTANTWVQISIDIVNDTPDDTDGTVDLTKIVSLVHYYVGAASFDLGDVIYFDDMDKDITTASGSPILRDAESALRDYNTTYAVDDVIDPATFKYTHSVTGLPDPSGTILLRTKPRISSGINIERILALYTESEVNEYWAFIVLEGVTASQSRFIESDALDNQQRNTNFRQQIVEPFTVYVFIPVANEIAARESRDEASDLLRPILRSLLFSRLSTGLYADVLNPVQFAGHDVYNYDTSVYVHAYSFQQVAEIYAEDSVGPDLDVAFRDIDFSIFSDFGTQVEFMQGTPDLDDTPL